MHQRQVFHTLDGLRGTAAIIVVLLHFELVLSPLGMNDTAVFKAGYLAVDLFFVLSGFVIEHSYGARLNSGMATSEFLLIRLIRLYPLYLLGTLIGLTSGIAAFLMGAGELDAGQLALASLAGLFILPSPTWGETPTLFVLNSPGWSLFLELLVNLFYVLLRPYLSSLVLIALIGGSGALFMLACTVTGSADLGPTWVTLPGALPRAAFGFFVGVLIYRWRERRIVHSGWALLIPLAAISILCLPVAATWRPGTDMVIATAVFPALILAGSRVEPPSPRLTRVFAWLGAISYPLYAIHYPLLELMRRGSRVAAIDLDQPSIATIILSTAGLMLLSWITAVRFDVPVRQALTQLLRRYRATPLARLTM